MSYDKTQIIVKGEDKTDEIRSYKKNGYKIDITYLNGKTYSYNARSVIFNCSILSNGSALSCFEYLKQIAWAVGVCDKNAGNILLNRYNKIDFIIENSMLAAFLTGRLENIKKISVSTTVYPFSFNISQKKAVDEALSNSLSIIEGPPGTGKTQTILNIIANAVMRGENVAVVSSNNSATANVLEKLKKYNVDFIAAYLGNSDNKQQFIDSQKPLPDISDWKLSYDQEYKIKQSLENRYISLNEMLSKRNELSQIKQELEALKLEYTHFHECCYYEEKIVSKYLKSATSDIALELWLLCEKYIKEGKMPGFWGRLLNWVFRGVKKKAFYSLNPEEMIGLCQERFYVAKISELTSIVLLLQKELEYFDFDAKMEYYSNLSAKLFRNALSKKYNNVGRHKFELDDLWKHSAQFINEYPVILATTYSLRSSLSHRVMYDYVIVDESSQVDIATGALALSCARKAVIVGDNKQLPNVVDPNSALVTDNIFTKFKLPEVYRYKNHSLLSAITAMFPTAPKILLREHYRCHPKIIGFCNQKFYNNQLIILTEAKSSRPPLLVYKTVPGNHAREHLNQRQIDVIREEIIPNHNLNNRNLSVGIVTPYRMQTNALQQAFSGIGIQADTVDKFQGREKDVIILSTVDNSISKFTDNPNRLNVAISRAIEELILVINGGEEDSDTNIGDLVKYIKYNNLEIVQSEVYSVFDYLYKGYYQKRRELLRGRKISKFDSENLIYKLIKEVINQECFAKFAVSFQVPLNRIIRNTERLNPEEKAYAKNMLTHTDFLIFDKLTKVPQLAIEIDGTAFHKEGTRQFERDKMKDRILEKYNIPFIRLKTNGSLERERLISKLGEISYH